MLRHPTMRPANLLWIICTFLLVTLGTVAQAWSIGWGLILTEIFLVLLPLIAVRLGKLDWRDTLRLRRWPGWAPLALGLLIGIGLWPLSGILTAVSMLIFGYQPPSPFVLSADDPGGIALMWIGVVLLPPICEEVLFRGYILRAYEGLGFKTSVLIVGGLFALWHLRLVGLLALLPVSVTLAYLARRSQSLLPGMLAHLATNGLSMAVMSAQAFNPDFSNGTYPAVAGGLCAFFVIGPLMALTSFWLFQRATAHLAEPSAPVAPPTLPTPAEKWFRPAWVFIVFGVVYLGFAGLELVVGRFPEALARQRLDTLTAPWSGAQHWIYELRDPLNAPIGRAECRLTPTAGAFRLACQMRQQAFDTVVKNPLGVSGRYISDDHERQIVARYDAQTLQLREASVTLSNTLGIETQTLTPAPSHTGLIMASDRVSETLAVPATIFLSEEWPWRLSALPFRQLWGGGARFTLAPGSWYQDGGHTPLPTDDVVALVRAQENVRTPAGDMVAWRVTVGDQTAWYAVKAPHPLIKFNTAGVTYLLTSATNR